MKEEIVKILRREEPDSETVSKSDRIIFYQGQLQDIGGLVGVPGKKTKVKREVIVEGKGTKVPTSEEIHEAQDKE